MTRSNLNFVWQNTGEAPRTLFHYHNGDQYPAGLLCFFGIEEFLAIDRTWTADDFRDWIAKNYREAGRAVATLPNGMTIDRHVETEQPAVPEDLGEGGQPRIHYTDGFLTDYSYVFQADSKGNRPDNRVTAWSWDERIFSGSAREFLTYCQREAKESDLSPLPHKSEQTMMAGILTAFGGDTPSPLAVTSPANT